MRDVRLFDRKHGLADPRPSQSFPFSARLLRHLSNPIGGPVPRPSAMNSHFAQCYQPNGGETV
jgi:hypothetical protein